jgi:hypothetical protein
MMVIPTEQSFQKKEWWAKSARKSIARFTSIRYQNQAVIIFNPVLNLAIV